MRRRPIAIGPHAEGTTTGKGPARVDFFNSDMVHTGFKIAGWAIVFGGLVYIPFRRSPTAAQAWILLFFFLPWVALPLYLVFGNARHPKWRRERIARLPAILERTIAEIAHRSPTGVDVLKTRHRITARLVERIGHLPPVHGNEIDLDGDYNRVVDRIAADIDRAQHHAHLCFYILQDDEAGNRVLRALERASARGVKCRLLVDAVGSSIDRHRIRRRMKKAGVEMHLILPWRFLNGATRLDLRNHRKFLIVDGHVAFTGSQNLIERTYHRGPHWSGRLEWKELMVRFEGPIVAGVDALFATDWYSETDELLLRETPAVVEADPTRILDAQVVPSGPAFEGENNLRLFNSLLYAAQEQIQICSPYFVPDESMLYAITTAAQSGLDVQLFVSEIGDQPLVFHAQRSYYEELLRAGVRIWLYRAPTVLHAKHFTIDDQVAVIGSSNMDMRSFSLNLEVSVMVRGASIISELRAIEQSYRDNSRELTLDDWMRRPRHMRIFDDLARVTATVQ